MRTVAEGGGGFSAPLWKFLAAKTGMSEPDGALPQIHAATDPQAQGGQFHGPRFGNFSPAVRIPVLRPGSDSAIETL